MPLKPCVVFQSQARKSEIAAVLVNPLQCFHLNQRGRKLCTSYAKHLCILKQTQAVPCMMCYSHSGRHQVILCSRQTIERCHALHWILCNHLYSLPCSGASGFLNESLLQLAQLLRALDTTEVGPSPGYKEWLHRLPVAELVSLSGDSDNVQST